MSSRFFAVVLGMLVTTSAMAAPVSVNFTQNAQVQSGFTLDFGFGPDGVTSASVADTTYELEIDPAAGTARFISYYQNVDELFLPTPNGPVGTGAITIEIIASLGGTFDRETGSFVTNDIYAVNFTGDLSAFGIESPFILPSSSTATVVFDSPNSGNSVLTWAGGSELAGAPFTYTCEVHGSFVSTNSTAYITSALPPHGAIDARQPHTLLDPAARQGWDTFDVSFNATPAAPIVLDDLLVMEWGSDGVPPAIAGVTDLGGNMIRVQLTEPIAPGAWTSLTHVASGTSICVASLPGDVNGDGTTGPSDILAVIDCINGVGSGACEPYSTDVDRSGQAGPADILRVIDLLNGAGTFDMFNGATLGDSPCF